MKLSKAGTSLVPLDIERQGKWEGKVLEKGARSAMAEATEDVEQAALRAGKWQPEGRVALAKHAASDLTDAQLLEIERIQAEADSASPSKKRASVKLQQVGAFAHSGESPDRGTNRSLLDSRASRADQVSSFGGGT